MISKEEAHAIAAEVVKAHRDEIEDQIVDLVKRVNENEWNEERAKHVATIAAGIAVQQITDNFYMSVGRKTIATIGATVVVAVITFKDYLKSVVGMR